MKKKILVCVLLIIIFVMAVIILVSNKTENVETELNDNENNLADSKEIDDELKSFLQYMAYLNEKNDVNYPGMTKDGIKLTIASYQIQNYDYNEDTGTISYKRENIEVSFKELFNEEIDLTTNGVFGLVYDKNTDSFCYEAGGDGYIGTYIIKVENKEYLGNGIYSVTFDYAYPDESDFYNGTIDECDSFRTQIEFKENKNYTYSKYQIVNEEKLKSNPLGKIKDMKAE